MDKVEIGASDALPMDDVAAGLIGLRIAFVNVFAVTHPDRNWTLFDSALPHRAGLSQNEETAA
jgi:hypothetical protein